MLSQHFIVSDLYSDYFIPVIVSSFVNNHAAPKLATATAAANAALK
jgi:hypothetical protein